MQAGILKELLVITQRNIVIKLIEKSDFEMVRNIFWETSAKDSFKSQEEKEHFEYIYLGYYLKEFIDCFFVYKEDEVVLGYICCEPFISSGSNVYKHLPYHENFRENFKEYPSELHINLSTKSQGKGIGSKLIDYLCAQLIEKKSSGVTAFTLFHAENVKFYKKNGFEEAAHSNGILMLGKKLSR